MRFFKLMYDYENDYGYASCDVAKIGNMNKYVTISGREINQWDNVVFEYNSTKGSVLTDYLANLYRWPIVSSFFRKLTYELIKNQVQYLPIKVIDNFTKVEINSYYVVNIVKTIDALDLEKSKYDIFELDDKKFISVEKYALRDNKICGVHIFRLKEDVIPIFVSDSIKKIIESNNLVGFKFLEVGVT